MERENNGSKVFLILILVVVAFCFGVIFGRNIVPSASGLLSSISSSNTDISLFWQVWDILEDRYVEKEKVSEEERVYGAVKGLVDSYGDPATIFLTPQETKDFNDLNSGKYFEGIGAELGYADGSIIIVSPLDGSPAKAAGIRAGDYILSVDDYEVKSGDNVYEIVQKIRGEAGTKVKLRILHKGDLEPVDMEITRGEITVPSMTLTFVGEKKDVAYIDITRFTESSLNEWESKWDSIVQGVKSQQEDGKGNVQTFDAEKGGRLIGKKVVVLVDEGSASASEIFAGALQQNGVATVVGSKTYGKGTAQSIVDLAGGSSIHITVLKWLLPDGSWLNRENSITPDVIVENSTQDFISGIDKQYNEALILINK